MPQVYARNKVSISATWEPPDYWGGCALLSYELQIREITRDGSAKEWATVSAQPRGRRAHTRLSRAHTPPSLCAPRAPAACVHRRRRRAERARGCVPPQVSTVLAHQTFASTDMNIYACDLRVRAYNVGTGLAGEWSEEVHLADEETEKAIQTELYRAALNASLSNRAARIAAARSGGGPGGGDDGPTVTAEEGVATITHAEGAAVDEGRGAPWVTSTDTTGWSDFAKVVGDFYVEAGVPRGVHGRLFELQPRQIEKLYAFNQKGLENVDANEPLVALSTCGVWVMETLAHHTENPPVWIDLINKIDGLVRLAGFHAIGELVNVPYCADELPIGCLESVDHAGHLLSDVSTATQMSKILTTLVKVHETMRQCMEGGYITCQLAHNYNKQTKANLKREWREYREELVAEIAEQVLCIAEHAASLSNGVPSDAETAVLAKMHEADRGSLAPSMAYLLACYDARATAKPPPVVSFTKAQAGRLTPAQVKLAKGGTTLRLSCAANGSSCRSLRSPHLSEPNWSLERLQLPVGTMPMSLEVALLGADDETVVGRTSFVMATHVGRFEAPLLDAAGKPSGGSVSFTFLASPPSP